MAEPETTGESIQMIRRVLYDLARQPGSTRDGATQPEIINYALAKRWPIPAREFEKMIVQLEKRGAIAVKNPWGVAGSVSETRYTLTAQGDLDEEHKRRGLPVQVLDELLRPPRIVDLAYLLAGVVVALIAQVIAHALRLI